jgi:hypothetical protein
MKKGVLFGFRMNALLNSALSSATENIQKRTSNNTALYQGGITTLERLTKMSEAAPAEAMLESCSSASRRCSAHFGPGMSAILPSQ